MSDSRTKNAIRNIAFGGVNRFVTLVLPFVTRTIVLYLLGASFLGIGTLFSSVLSFLSLAELGLGSAIVYSMYKPIAENDVETVSALLRFYKKLYRVIGLIILTVGTILVPFIPFLIKGEPPTGINVYFLYYLYLMNSVVSYFFAGYRQSLLAAHQRLDITSNITTLVNLFIQAGQILALYLTKNFYVYAIVPICGTLITNLFNYLITKRKYPYISCRGNISKEQQRSIKKKISGLFGTKLNSIVVHSTDTLVISSFLGLTVTAQYGNYYYIMNAVCGFIAIFYSSITAGIGNKLVTDSMEENYTLFKGLSFINFWMVGWCSACFVCLYEPFMKLWVGEKLQLGFLFAVLLTSYFFIYEIQRTILTFKDAAGLWHKDQLRPYVSMLINVVTNIILVQFLGVYGIVISTILAFLVSLPWANHVLFRHLFKKNPIKNLATIALYALVTVAACSITYLISTLCPEGILGLMLQFGLCIVVPNVIFFCLFFKSKEFIFMTKKLKSLIKRKR